MRCQSGLWSSGLLGIYVGVRQSIETMEFIFGGGLTLTSHLSACERTGSQTQMLE